MNFLDNIKTVGRFEAITLRRSWFFRLFSIAALFIFSILNMGYFSPVGDQTWEFMAFPSSLPYVNLYLLNIGQAIVVIFLAADFLKRDKKVDTNEVLYTRSMSNFEYVLGKTWGIMKLFLGLNIIILFIALIINIVNKIVAIDILAYLQYLVLISVPTLTFSLGIAFMLMMVLRNQAITFLILLGMAAGNMFWGYYRLGGIFDYMAFGFPLLKSQITGFDNLSLILYQRGMFFFLGMALIFSTIILFNRLPQSKTHTALSWIITIVFLAGAGWCCEKHLSSFIGAENDRENVIAINKMYEDKEFVSVIDTKIDFVHQGDAFSSTVELKFINDNNTAIDNYIFSLNPSLKVISIKSDGKELPFKTTGHIIEVKTTKPLLQGETDSLTISYSGTINEAFCYPDYIDNTKDNPYKAIMLNINKRQAFVDKDYLLLTPESHWYPVAGLNYYPSNPARIKIDFSRYHMKVKTSAGLIAVSQGESTREGEAFVFDPKTPLTGISLAIGNYKTDKIVVDSITYINNYFEGNDYYKNTLAEIADTLPSLITGFMRDLEINFTTAYPFPTLSFVEVPIQFYSYPRMGSQTRAEMQPSLVLLPEKLATMRNAGFDVRFKRQKRRMERNNEITTDKELKVRLFNDFIVNSFISGSDYRYVNGVAVNEPTRFRLGPSFYFFKNNFYSNEYPVINAVFETHLQKVELPAPGTGYGGATSFITNNDMANMILKDYSFSELLGMRPLGDTLNKTITLKGDYLFSIFRSKGGIEEFNEWFKDYIERTKFNRISIQKFNNDVLERFGFEFYGYLDDWFNGKAQPGFQFANLRASEIVVDNRVRYLVSFVAYNPETVSGIFNVSFNTAEVNGQGGGNTERIEERGRGLETADIKKIVFLEPGEVKEINIILETQPRVLLINALFSKNIPGEISLPINQITKSKTTYNSLSEEVKLTEFPDITDPGIIIVDNEDPGFSTNQTAEPSPLRKLLRPTDNQGTNYDVLRTRTWAIPNYWQPILENTYYGKYVLSSVYTRAGGGEKELIWTADITEPGFYDVFCYVGKAIDGGRQNVTGGRNNSSSDETVIVITVGGGGERPASDDSFKDMHYTVYHEDGADEIVFDYSGASGGWNSLGNFYLQEGPAKVSLSNLSEGNIVIGDAIRWVKTN
jgi:hypothetical protein